jgi:uncharacterized protein (TIGR02466 family)
LSRAKGSVSLRGRTLASQGRLREAQREFERALAADPGSWELRHQLAQVLMGLQSWREAVAELALIADSGQATALQLSDLGVAAFELGELERSRAAFERALEVERSCLIARVHLGHLHASQGHSEAALACYGEVLQAEPSAYAALVGRAELRQAASAWEPALEDLALAAWNKPHDYDVLRRIIEVMRRMNRPEAALERCREFLEQNPQSSGGLSLLALLEREAGNEALAASLLDYDEWLFQDFWEPPEGTTLEAFSAELARQVQAHPSLVRAPRAHATQAGWHSGALSGLGEGPLAWLEEQLSLRVAEIWRRLPEAPHPTFRHRPAEVTLNLWAVVLEAGGHQVPHIHPEAWLSGVTYVELPSLEGQGPEGELEFGEPDPALLLEAPQPKRRLVPEVGKLYAFPSFYYHRTLPFEGAGRRISIAFDVIPLRR